MSHVPVMAGEVMHLIGASADQLLLDLTVGAGGHSRAFLERTGTGRIIGCDRDAEALAVAEANLAGFGQQVRLRAGDFVTCLRALAQEECCPDAVLMDLGVSSMQLDEGARGFSLREDGPLDMRMDTSEPVTAAELVNRASEQELESWLRDLGDEPRARRIAQAIVARRGERPFRTTGDLRLVVESALGRRGGRIHPATRTFQALRMRVNRELPLLEEALDLALGVVRPGGHLAVIAFHSGEDRIVKNAFRAAEEAGRGRRLTKKPVRAPLAEQRRNRRSRSARLRVLRTAVKGA